MALSDDLLLFHTLCAFIGSAFQASIESIAESMALAEKHGVDRQEVMQLLSSTIFDCLIYKVPLLPFLIVVDQLLPNCFRLSILLPLHPSLPFPPLSIHPSIYLFIYLFIYLSIDRSISLFI